MKGRFLSLVLAVGMTIFAYHQTFAQNMWISQNSGTSNDLYSVQFIDTNIGYAAGAAGTVVKTTDGGTNWTSVPVETNYPIRDLSFIDETTGWVVTGDPDNSSSSGSVWYTSDGGDSWTEQSLGTTQARLGVSFVSSDDGWACGANNGPWDIRATTDGGSSWHSQSGSGFGWTYDIDCISAEMGWSVGVVYFPSSTGFVMKTSNGGSTWNQLNTGTIPFLFGVQFVDSDHGYVVGDAGTVLGSTDGGTGWTDLQTGAAANLKDLSFLSSEIGWVCGDEGTVLSTTDAGSTWEDSPSGADVMLNGICFVNEQSGWTVGMSGTILKYEPATGIDEKENSAPREISISGNYPNPFNNSTMIELNLEKAAELNLGIYNVIGQRVESLYSGNMNAGKHEIVWNADSAPSGVYFARVETAEQTQSIKMLMLK